MATGTFFTLGEAAKQTGVQKSTLSKALKSGKLSFVEKTSAGYKIDPSELFRVYPRKPQETVSETVASELPDTPDKHPDFIRLQVEVEQLRERLTETQTQRDEWMKQAQQLALPAPSNTSPEVEKSPRRSLFSIFGGER
ncbi:DNA binding domain-containing protein, excisionase family [Epibacterium ulvae]|uniref:DNA binding domain-containing protein, excisionase family n=1 Tax=Epibacterium ulvae TaxID=1156985 RepID=A0A1G5RJT8_9RHOB|nr:hypothetical protein [Epibacterium ulvae]SCZ74307.1 DNA binding domain-containing protein, excisionase family [Epibacterium ulvae]